MKTIISISILLLSLNSYAEKKEVKPVLIKSVGSFQLNPIDESENDALFSFQGMIDDCFNSSSILKEEPVKRGIITDIINQKIKSSTSVPTIRCSDLISSYKERIQSMLLKSQ